MFGETLKKYLQISLINLKHNNSIYILISALLLCLTPIIFSINNLDTKAAAIPLEMFVSLIGIVLLTPSFLPEQQNDIKELVESKYTSHIVVYVLRILLAAIALFLMIFAFLLIMAKSGSDIPMTKYTFGTFASALFLGSLGILACGITNNITFGYMLPILFYVLNIFSGARYLGKLYLFSLTQGSMTEKYFLFVISIILISLTLVYRSVMQKIR